MRPGLFQALFRPWSEALDAASAQPEKRNDSDHDDDQTDDVNDGVHGVYLGWWKTSQASPMTRSRIVGGRRCLL